MKQQASIVAILTALTQIFCTVPAYAWNSFGHMSVAYVAYKKMTPQARERALALLKLNPYYEKWRAEIGKISSPQEEQEQIFMLAATWPDQIRNDPDYKSDGEADGSRPKGQEATQNIGYSDHCLHKYWHHYDKPMATDSTKLPPVQKPNAQTQIAVFRKVISSDAPDEIKSYDLTWLLHLVGDLHQPLHCITRVSKDEPEGDDCALKVKLTPPDSLHWFWDCALGTEPPGKVAELSKTLPEADKSLAADLHVNDWIEEGYKLAKEKVYIPPIKAGNGPFELTDIYKRNAYDLAKQRVAMAGERLANLLNKELN